MDYKNKKVDVIKHIHEDDLQEVLEELTTSNEYNIKYNKIYDIKIMNTNGFKDDPVYGNEQMAKHWQYCNIVVFYE